jgi:DNA end-binding protein Ku
MRAIWKGTISFGLVNIPIAVGIATQRSDPRFRTLDAKALQPIRQQLFSPARDEVIEREDTVKGYEVSKDRFVVISDEELESVAVERRRSIDIVAFVDADEIDPVYYDRTYYLEPQDGADKPYALLVQAMRDTGRAALGKMVLSSREHLVLLRPSGSTLVVELLFYPEDVRSKDAIEERVSDVEVREAELEMAKQLVESLTQPFDPAAYENEHKRELMALIERKIAGEEIEVAAEAPAPRAAPDLMAALKASLEQARGGEAVEEAKPAPKRRAAAKPKAANGKPKPKPKAAPKRKAPAKG